jgi:hypothetical protein
MARGPRPAWLIIWLCLGLHKDAINEFHRTLLEQAARRAQPDMPQAVGGTQACAATQPQYVVF